MTSEPIKTPVRLLVDVDGIQPEVHAFCRDHAIVTVDQAREVLARLGSEKALLAACGLDPVKVADALDCLPLPSAAPSHTLTFKPPPPGALTIPPAPGTLQSAPEQPKIEPVSVSKQDNNT